MYCVQYVDFLFIYMSYIFQLLHHSNCALSDTFHHDNVSLAFLCCK